jgi:hypothetical protein
VRRAIPIALTLALAAAGIAGAFSTPTYSVEQVKKTFRNRNGVALVRFAAASTPEVTSLRTRPHRTARFGEFQLFVFRPSAALKLRRTFTQGVRPDRRRIYWVPDQAGGEIAVTLYGRNLCVGWFPPAGAHFVDARWERLQAAVKKIL